MQFFPLATSIHEHLRGLLAGGCSCHLGSEKTLALIWDKYFCPRLKSDVKICELCRVCQLAKKENDGMYQPLPVPHPLRKALNIDFTLGLSQTAWNVDLVFMMVDQFSKMAHFILVQLQQGPPRWLNYFFERLPIFMDFQSLLRQAVIPSSWAIFRRLFGWQWRPSFISSMPTTLRPMVKQKW